MKKRILKRAVRLYASTYLAGIMGVFIYLSVGTLIGMSVQGQGMMNPAAMAITNAVTLFTGRPVFCNCVRQAMGTRR